MFESNEYWEYHNEKRLFEDRKIKNKINEIFYNPEKWHGYDLKLN